MRHSIANPGNVFQFLSFNSSNPSSAQGDQPEETCAPVCVYEAPQGPPRGGRRLQDQDAPGDHREDSQDSAVAAETAEGSG